MSCAADERGAAAAAHAPEFKVFEYSAGGAFGELALLHGEPRLATVRATEPSV